MDRNETIRSAFEEGKTQQSIANEYGVTRQRIQQILKRFSVTRKDGGQYVRSVAKETNRSNVSRWRKDPMAIAWRFWSRVGEAKANGCMEWKRSLHVNGYGHCSTWASPSGYAHRAAWRFANGEIPDGLLVLHHCDNPPCCNPSHLYLGTQKDNMRDRDQRGRGLLGRRKPFCKRGHRLAGDNVYTYKDNYRSCRTCGRERDRIRWSKKSLDSRQEIV